MELEITDIDHLSEDRNGNARFVAFANVPPNLPYETIIDAELRFAGKQVGVSCKIYRPRPNGKFDQPHLHVSVSKLWSNNSLSVGDFIVLEECEK